MVILSLLPLLLLGSCKRVSEKVEVVETRRLTVWDEPNLPIIAPMPPEWRKVPSTEHRALNYRFGKAGEVYVSNSKGGVLPNVNRWLKQFDQNPLVDLNSLQQVSMLGGQGVFVEAVGRFGGGMGKAPRENSALLGVVLSVGESLLTVKMIGPKEEVLAERKRLVDYCNQLRFNEE